MASARNGTLYIGVTSALLKRVHEHKSDAVEGFTKTHRVHVLVWFEQHETMAEAIVREKRLKKWNRAWKIVPIDIRIAVTGISGRAASMDPRFRGDD